ncbi:hypothetical protein ACE7GA_21850 [Roseomonas sp. CCTCC AB2023176]|uniref:hypothetical protein n=1 Tax=Roseomonas sp. CCTCC AB2023176 TaxID=3342640 RepID=UPI0035DFF675
MPASSASLDPALPPALQAALRDALARQSCDVVVARGPHLAGALDLCPPGLPRVLHVAHAPAAEAAPDAAVLARQLDRADLILAADAECPGLRRLTARPVAALDLPVTVVRRPDRGSRRIGLAAGSDPADLRAAAAFVPALDLGRLAGRGGVLRVGGPLAARLGAARRGLELLAEEPSADDLDLLVCPGETDATIAALRALATGVPVIGTGSALRGLAVLSPSTPRPMPPPRAPSLGDG